ncbi:HNH endonuclease [Brachybacterium huguangmaarense]|uniref:HNH endonuclease n=1 Tax=Brachybacterium huguangmaarense TaxID=1652028 RepID=A0ABY6FZT1_9MICO|nr:HNH endonuclease signature motif containing protein [Brachybacterium huguangmaarense]UYG16224.1 HNH endonuclease [Brachybacterium huguangmaarense]
MASILAGVLAAVEAPVAMRDGLVDTEPGSVAEALGVVGVIDQLRSTLAALDATWQVMAATRIADADAIRGVPTAEQGRAAAQELSLARRVSPSASSMSLAASQRLVTQLPSTFSLLAAGRVTESQARAIAVALDDVDPDVAASIDEVLTADPARLVGVGTRRLGAEVRALRDARDPDDARRRTARAARGRCVRTRLLEDHMVAVTATVRAVDASAVMKALRLEAEARRAQGSIDGVRALEADALVDAITGGDRALDPSAPPESLPDAEFVSLLSEATVVDGDGRVTHTRPHEHETEPPVVAGLGSLSGTVLEPGTHRTSQAVQRKTTDNGRSVTDRYRHRRITIGVVITDRALLAPDGAGELAHLEGYGPIPAQIITDSLRGKPPGYKNYPGWDEHPDASMNAAMRRLYTHPRTGELVAMDSGARAFPASLEQMVRWRESTCASPWCNATVRHIDHITPHAHGGKTSYRNAQGLCVRCNLLKDHAGWIITPTRDGDGAPAVTWTSPGNASTTCHLTPLGPRERTGDPADVVAESSSHSASAPTSGVDGTDDDQSGPTAASSGPADDRGVDDKSTGMGNSTDTGTERPDPSASGPSSDPERAPSSPDTDSPGQSDDHPSG